MPAILPISATWTIAKTWGEVNVGLRKIVWLLLRLPLYCRHGIDAKCIVLVMKSNFNYTIALVPLPVYVENVSAISFYSILFILMHI